MAHLWDAIRASAARGGAVIANPAAEPAVRAATTPGESGPLMRQEVLG
jgi:hypothetical protein